MDRDSANIEARFIALGVLLEKLTKTSGALVKDSDLLTALATGKGETGEVVKRTTRALTPALEYVKAAGSELNATVATLHELDGHISGLLAAETDLRRALEPLHFLKVLFRLETAALPRETQAGFANLMADIDALRHQVQTIFERNHYLLASTRGQLSKVIGKMEKSAGFYAAASASKDRITASLNELELEIARNAGHETELTAVTRSLSKEMGRILVALQAQDIVSQRLSHVNQALDLFVSELDRKAERIEDQPARLRRIRALTSIQRLQIESAQASLGDAVGACRDAAEQIGDRMRVLSTDCRLLREFSAVTASAGRMVHLLLDSIQDVKSMLSECMEVTAWAREAVAPISAAAAGLSSDICGITEQMRRIALNTHLRALEMAGGNGLEVLAAHTRMVSADATAISADASSRLEKLTTGFDRIAANLQELHQRGAAGKSTLDGQASVESVRLNSLSSESRAVLDRVSKTIDLLTSQVNELQSESDLALLTRGIGGVQQALAALETEVSRIADRTGAGQASHEEHAEFAAAYTMESERVAHALAVGEHAEATVASGDFELF